MALVLDSSMALSWCLPWQSGTAGWAVLRRVENEGAVVPAIWHLEVANILGLKARSGFLSEAGMTEAVRLLSLLDIATDEETARKDYQQHLALMARFRLTTYDATYLDVAVRKGLPLATLDKAMIASARTNGVPVLPAA